MIHARVFVIATLVVLTSCTGRTAAASPVVVDIVMTEYSYEPQLIEAPPGREIRLSVTNAGKVDHDLVVDEFGTRLLLPAGGHGNVKLSPPAPGAYVVHCTIPTHRELGMLATLLVR